MIDTAKITVCGGNGGDGLITFRRGKLKPKGPPMGGSGAKGGDVYLVANNNIATLKDFVSSKIFKAQDGTAGGPNDRTGKCGEDLIVRVPIGTTIADNSGKILVDLDNKDQTILVAKGGAGGHGNAHMMKDFRNEDATLLVGYTGKRFSKEKHIYYAERGKSGERAEIKLDLKLIADIGIVGLPNAGKSSLLNTITKTTKATVGSYPFTTLEPNLGVISTHTTTPGVKNFHTPGVLIADIPGLIEGAHKGRGLGDKFLKHVERTKLLIHVISTEKLTSDGKSITKTDVYKTIRDELYKWNRTLIEKPEIIVINKIDMADDPNQLKKQFQNYQNIIFVSAITGEGIESLRERIMKEVNKEAAKAQLRKQEQKQAPYPTKTFTIETLPNKKIVF